MKAKNMTVYGLRFDYRLPEETLLGTTQLVAWENVVTPGTMVNGDFHTPNSWSYTIRQEKRQKGTITRWEGVSKYLHQYRGYLSGPACNLPTWDRTSVYNRALDRLNSKTRGDLDLAVDLAESGQTFRMVKALRDVLDYAKGGFWKRTGDVANGWLQYQYGWRPLLQSVYDVTDETARRARSRLTKVTGSAVQSLNGTYNTTKLVNSKLAACNVRTEGKSACRITLTLEPIEGWDLSYFSSLNPISLAWEWIPYSFVVDWFYDVGSWLRNTETAFLYRTRFKSGFVSELIAYDGYESYPTQYTSGSYGPSTWERIDSVKQSVRYRKFYRTKLTSYPFPRIPSFKVDLGSQRMFSAAALLRQLLR